MKLTVKYFSLAHILFRGFVLDSSCIRVNTVHTRNYTKIKVTLTYIHTHSDASTKQSTAALCTSVSRPGAFILTVTATISCCNVLPGKKKQKTILNMPFHTFQKHMTSAVQQTLRCTIYRFCFTVGSFQVQYSNLTNPTQISVLRGFPQLGHRQSDTAPYSSL